MLKAPLGFVTERGFSSFQFVRAPGRVPLNPLMNRGFWAHGCAPYTRNLGQPTFEAVSLAYGPVG